MAKCPKCGTVVAENDKRCSKCGEPLSNTKKSSNKLIAIIAIVAIVAIAGVLASGIFSSDSSTADIETQSETVEPVIEDDETNEPTEYWASEKAEKFHLPTCEWAEKISEDNKIIYQSREDAIADGKVPCGACNP